MVKEREKNIVLWIFYFALIGDEATAKIYLPQKNYVILRAANKSVNEDGTKRYPDIKTKELVILGVVDNVMHRPRVRL